MDSPQRPCLPGYPCLVALVCDLQSMLHKTLTHLTVITNKHHAQSSGLLFCLPAQAAGSSLCGPSLEKAKKCPGLLSLRGPRVERDKGELGKKLYSQAPSSFALRPSASRGSAAQKGLGRWGRGLLSLHCPRLRPCSFKLNVMYLPNNFRVRHKMALREEPGPAALFLKPNSSLLGAPGIHLHPSHEQ